MRGYFRLIQGAAAVLAVASAAQLVFLHESSRNRTVLLACLGVNLAMLAVATYIAARLEGCT